MQKVEGAKEKKLNGRVKRSGFRMSEHGDVVNRHRKVRKG
jgi:hypothetical protein